MKKLNVILMVHFLSVCIAFSQVRTFEKMIGDAVLQSPDYVKLGTLFLARTNSPNIEILNHVINGVAAGLTAIGKGDVYIQRIRPFVADPQTLEASLTISCEKCSETGTQEIKCSSCNGSGICKNTGCRNGITTRPVMNGGDVESPCLVCKGTGKCPKCDGTGVKTVVCTACGGRKTIFSSNKAAAIYSQEMQAALKCFDEIRLADEQRKVQAEEKRKNQLQVEEDRKAKVAHAAKLRQAEIEGKRIAAAAEGEALGKEKARLAAEAERERVRLEEDKKYSARDQQYLKSVVVVQGDRGAGTGFLCLFKGKKVVISNAHVLCGNRKILLATTAGKNLQFTKIYVCKKENTLKDINDPSFEKYRDLVVYEIVGADDIPPLELYDVGKKGLTNQEKIAVFGNSQGQNVATTLRGQVTGHGPDSVEVDTKFVHGNSGGPIIAYDYNAVVGMVTYMKNKPEVDWTNRSSKFADVRYFGVRVDNVEWSDLEELDREKYDYFLKTFDDIVCFASDEWPKIEYAGNRYSPAPVVIQSATKLIAAFKEIPEWIRCYADEARLAEYVCTAILSKK